MSSTRRPLELRRSGRDLPSEAAEVAAAAEAAGAAPAPAEAVLDAEAAEAAAAAAAAAAGSGEFAASARLKQSGFYLRDTGLHGRA